MYKVCLWSKDIEKEAFALLRKYQETSMFLLNNLKECGANLGELFYSGNFKCLLENDEVVAVFCLTKKGNVLMQSDRKDNYSFPILSACLDEGIQIRGCVADWSLAEPFWKLYIEKFPDIKTTTFSQELLFSLRLSPNVYRLDSVRFLAEDDFELWEKLNTEYFKEMHFPAQGSEEDRRIAFKEETRKKHWWGLFEEEKLISIAAYNARVDDMAQIGGVYTLPDYRKKGYSIAVLKSLISDSKNTHKLDSLLLFTDRSNIAASNLYMKLGFKEIGSFGLIFGEKQ